MKLNVILLKQHIGRHFKRHWAIQGKKKIQPTPAVELLEKEGILIHKPEDIYKEKRTFERVEVIGYKPIPVKFDHTHPNWHDQALLTYKDTNVLLEGLDQAQVLTNTVKIAGLPKSYHISTIPKGLNKQVKNFILNSHILDAEQEKLPKRKDPERPAWNFPRDYGVTFERRNKLMTSKLLQLLETHEKHDIVKDRYIFDELPFTYLFFKDGVPVQFQLVGSKILTSRKPLACVTDESTESLELPNLYPIKPTVTLKEENIYKLENIYLLKENVHPHTLFTHYDKTRVKNSFEEEVTENQIRGRSLLYAYTVASLYAKQKFGEEVKELPSPVTLQSIQTDGRFFHFGVLQLNSLNPDGGVRNVWHETNFMNLFGICQYEAGSPVLNGYNDEVVKHLISFYKKN